MEIGGFGIYQDLRLQSDTLRDNLTSARSFRTPENFRDLLERTNNSGKITARNTGGIDKNDRLYELCLELETFLVKNLLTSMRNTVQKSGLIDDGFAGKMYEDMLYDEYAKSFTKNAGFGLAEQAYRQLINLY
ncbi:MAG: rod-binding protein [Treponema sp.]|nr:rod-binding protein [Treponema sp.]